MTPTYIMVHHSLTADSGTVSWPAIRRYHINIMRMKDIGYHYGIEFIKDSLGNGYYEVLAGRPEDLNGAACPQGNMNQEALHICVIGNFDDVSPSDDLYLNIANRLIKPLIRRYNIPINNVVAHRDYNPAKSCPGMKFSMNKLRDLCR